MHTLMPRAQHTQVDQLDLTKPKATELLKAHDGDAVRAMEAFIAVPV